MSMTVKWSTSLDWASWNGAVSNVVDTGSNDNILTNLLVSFNSSGDLLIEFSFRASNQEFDATDDESVLSWSNYTFPGQILNDENISRSELGLFIQGRYLQVRTRLTSYEEVVQSEEPDLIELIIGMAQKNINLGLADSMAYADTVLSQLVNFSGTKRIDKVSIEVFYTQEVKNNYFISKNGNVVFAASNWQESRDSWVVQPANNNVLGNEWETSGTSIQNELQLSSYTDSDDAVINSPYIEYNIFFDKAGTYDVWSYASTLTNDIYYAFNNDTTNIRSMNVGYPTEPIWQQFGTIYIPASGVYSFTVYLSGQCILDQWMFTCNPSVSQSLRNDYRDINAPLPASEGPFTLALRLRNLVYGEKDDLDNPEYIPVTAWLSSTKMYGSGKYNFEIKYLENVSGMEFIDGLSLELWQIGGGDAEFSSWNYNEI